MRCFLPLFLGVLACNPPAEDSADDVNQDTETAVEPVETGDTSETGDTGGDTEPPVTDADEDGYDAEAHGGTDCDDEDPEVNPGATETWYDGVDSDCSGGSDYDADGDGADAEAYGGTDCDDEDATVQEDCVLESILDAYTLATERGEIEEILSNLSGITWNPATGTFMAVLDSNRTLVELDADMAVVRMISLDKVAHRDMEDIVYLGADAEGTPSYAIVTEDNVLYLGAVPDDGAKELNTESWQTVTYAADDSGNSGGEGVAYDPATQTFWVCKEWDPMAVYTFARPKTGEDVSYEDGSLKVSEAFDAETLLGKDAGDLASCLFDERTGRLLILSERSDLVLDVATDGTLFGTLDLDGSSMSKPEGITLLDDGDMVVVGEPNQWVRYEYGGR